MSYMRIYKEFGQLVFLLQVCIADMKQFIVFLISWILFFTAFYQILGVEFDNGDYQDLNPILIIFLQTFRNSIGDISTPQYPIWSSYASSDDPYHVFQGYSMMAIIWIFWFFHEFIILIILLNFLIAIIS